MKKRDIYFQVFFVFVFNALLTSTLYKRECLLSLGLATMMTLINISWTELAYSWIKRKVKNWRSPRGIVGHVFICGIPAIIVFALVKIQPIKFQESLQMIYLIVLALIPQTIWYSRHLNPKVS